MRAVNIKWDVDYGEDGELLPTEVEIPKDMTPQQKKIPKNKQ
jgi:hypothetical protein